MKKIFSFIVLTAIVIAANVGAASENAKEILARAKQASGGPAWDSIRSIYTKMKITTAGLNGTAESWEDILTGRVFARFELGPMTGAQGFDGKVLWSKDSSKQVRAEQQRLRELSVALEQSKRAVALATERYERGLTDFLNVLDAERQEFAIEDQNAVAQEAVVIQYIALYNALGGGWELYDELPPLKEAQPALVATVRRLTRDWH